MVMPATCVAILAVRNEEAHIGRALENYIGQGIDVVVVDHSSTDETVRVCTNFLNKGTPQH